MYAGLIKKMRIDMNMTQKIFADACFTALRTIQAWEDGKAMPSKQSLGIIYYVGEKFNCDKALLNKFYAEVKQLPN
jgi:DNA-binding transcriptional regulator YiaG